jgi:hypothetical protein
MEGCVLRHERSRDASQFEGTSIPVHPLGLLGKAGDEIIDGFLRDHRGRN